MAAGGGGAGAIGGMGAIRSVVSSRFISMPCVKKSGTKISTLRTPTWINRETAQSRGLRRWRVVEFSSRASARTRYWGATSGGVRTMPLVLVAGYTPSRKRYCSLNIRPPKNWFRKISQQTKIRKSFAEAHAKSFLNRDTARCLTQTYERRESWDIPIQRGEQSMVRQMQAFFS